jgi:hypothetical protein
MLAALGTVILSVFTGKSTWKSKSTAVGTNRFDGRYALKLRAFSSERGSGLLIRCQQRRCFSRPHYRNGDVDNVVSLFSPCLIAEMKEGTSRVCRRLKKNFP